ncbi:MAG: hypothetical protein ACQEXN_16570 [Actinomycetota bacterium]
MDPSENPAPEHPDDVENEASDQPAGSGDTEGEVHEAHIPVHGDEKLADDLVKKAYGDKDDDGRGDAPNAPFP